MTAQRVGAVATVAVPVALVLSAWAGWFAGGLTLADVVDSYLLTNSAMALTFCAFAALILWHRPGHLIGLLFAGYGWCYTVSVVCLGLLTAPIPLSPTMERWVTVVGVTVWVPAVTVCLPLILQVFPNGTVLSRRWRPLAWLTLGLLPLAPSLALVPDALAEEPIADRTSILPQAAGTVVAAVVPVYTLLCGVVLLASLVSLGLRAHRATGSQRLQVLWLVWAVVVFVVLNAQRIVTTDGPILLLLTLPLIPAAATVAVVRHELYDIRLIINRSLVWGLLTVGVVAAYLGLVALFGALAEQRLAIAPVVATGIVSLAFSPARAALQSGVDRLMYGERRAPEHAVARVGARLGTGLGGVLDAVCETLRLPYAAITVGDDVVASHGTAPAAEHAVALEPVDGLPARLVVGLRRGEARASTADARALALLAGPVGVALQSVRLSDELRQSRSRIIAAREEERRRLRRDLHDGLGTALTAVTLKADAAYNLREVDPGCSAGLLVELRADLTAAIADIRRLVYELRPPDLDELGLMGAVRQRAEQSWRRVDGSFRVTVDGPETLPALPAAVEVAGYRIITEAVTNALRHADATGCTIAVRADDALDVEVCDDGGSTGPWPPGVGLRSMAERIAELGGQLTTGPTDVGGRVHARLPLQAA
jgi:signal transduction histidine kinase